MTAIGGALLFFPVVTLPEIHQRLAVRRRADRLLRHLGAGRVVRGPISNSFDTVRFDQTMSIFLSAGEKL